MKRTGRCPKCQSLEIASGGGGWTEVGSGAREYTVYLCLACGLEERYVNAPRERGFALVTSSDGPFR